MSQTVARRPAAWLFSPALDLLVGCGAWTLPLLALTFFLQRENAGAVAFAFYLLAVFCNNPHYMATIHRAYHTAEDFNKYRFFTVYVTVLLALAVELVHLVPGLFPWVFTFYLTWSPWHYTGQNFGIAQMFVRRAGAHAGDETPPDAAARQLLYASYAASFGFWLVTRHAAREADDLNFLSLNLPETLTTPLQLFLVLAFLGCAGAAFLRLARRLPLRALVGPLTLTLTQLLWFIAPALVSRFSGRELPASYFSVGALAFMHCAQYLWITTYYARRETTADAPGRRRFNFWHYYLVLVVGGLALFVPGPWIASRLFHHDFVESLTIFVALVNLHHFILDGAIWKLRDGRIARLLLGTNREPASEAAADEQSLRHHLGWLFGATQPARIARFAFGGAILGIGALDQWQFLATSRAAGDAALARAAAINPYDSRPSFRRAQQLAAAGHSAAAQRELARVLALNPRNAPAQHLLGELIFRSGDTAAALAHYDRMAALFRPDLAVATNRGLLEADRGRSAVAAERFAEALRLAPHQTGLHILLGDALLAAGEPARAIAQYELFTTLFEESRPANLEAELPRYLAAALKLGQLYSHATPPDPARAERWLQRAADVAATCHKFMETADALGQLAALQEQLGRPAEAAKNRELAAQAARFAR